MKVRDRVQYKAEFCRNTGIYTGNLPRAKGRIISINDLGSSLKIAKIKWDLPDVPEKVNVKNLQVIE